MEVVNKARFDELCAKGTVVVDFYADWCGPCKMLGPVMEEVAKEYPDITFVKVNCDEEEELAAQFSIMSIPAVYMVKGGQTVARFIGLQSKSTVQSFIENNK